MLTPRICKAIPLHCAAYKGFKDIVELLIANKADIDANNNYGETPLHWTAVSGHEDVAELLLASGANVDAETERGVTPLHWAESRGHKDVADLLRQHGGHDLGSDISALDRGWTGN